MLDIVLSGGLEITLMDNHMSHESVTFMELAFVLVMFLFHQQKFIGSFASIALYQVSTSSVLQQRAIYAYYIISDFIQSKFSMFIVIILTH